MPDLFDKNENRIVTIPNILSLLHIAFLPFIFHFLKKGDQQSDIISAVLIWAGSSIDVLDGYIARRFNQTSNLGRILDPLADKVFTITLMLFLVSFKDLPIWYLIVVLIRDIAIIICGLYVMLKKQFISEPTRIGKYASFSFLPVLLTYTLELGSFALLMLYISLGLILLSVVSYAKVFYRLCAPNKIKEGIS
jgi:cardiolipin synthase